MDAFFGLVSQLFTPKVKSFSKQRLFVVPFDENGIYLFKTNEEVNRLIGEVKERDPSILFTIARTIVEESYQLFPRCIPEDVHDRKNNHGLSLFYYNPLILEILESLMTEKEHQIFFPENDNLCGLSASNMEEQLPIRVAFKVSNSEKIDIGTLNREYFTKLGNQIGKTIRIGRVIPEQIQENSCIVQGYVKQNKYLKKNIEVDKAIYIVGGDKNKHWSLMQEAMIIGQFAKDCPLSWIRIRSEEELFQTNFSNIKVLIVAGSFDSDADIRPFQSKSLKPIFDKYTDLKFFGYGSGAVLLAPISGLKVEHSDTQEITFLGRRQLTLPNLSQPMILQYVRGSWKITSGDSSSATNQIVSSDDFGIESFISKDKRILATIAHPDYNRAFMQEQVISEYFKKHMISPEFNIQSYLQAQKSFEQGSEIIMKEQNERMWSYVSNWATNNKN